MTTNPYERVHKIQEVATDCEYGDTSALTNVNKLIADGWTLLAVHQRSWQSDGEAFWRTVYVLGWEFSATEPKEWQTE